jgi:hypothetical protein
MSFGHTSRLATIIHLTTIIRLAIITMDSSMKTLEVSEKDGWGFESGEGNGEVERQKALSEFKWMETLI